MDRELRHVVAGVEAAGFAPDFLAVAVEIDTARRCGSRRRRAAGSRPRPASSRIACGSVLMPTPSSRMRVGLLEDLAVDAARAQHQRRGETADTAADDNRLHRPPLQLDYDLSRQMRPACRASARARIHPGRPQAALSPPPCSSARVFGLALILSSSRSCRSRTLLRKICSLPGRYCGGQDASSRAVPGRRLHGEDGSTRCGRPSATRSARPAARMVLTWSAVVMLPTHMVATRASLRTWSENGVWNMRP